MTIPKKVKIGGIVYTVNVTDDWLDRGGADGQVIYDQDQGNVIYIADWISPEAQAVTLIHEALHCMNSTMSHEFLDSLSEQIYQFFKDNKIQV